MIDFHAPSQQIACVLRLGVVSLLLLNPSLLREVGRLSNFFEIPELRGCNHAGHEPRSSAPFLWLHIVFLLVLASLGKVIFHLFQLLLAPVSCFCHLLVTNISLLDTLSSAPRRREHPTLAFVSPHSYTGFFVFHLRWSSRQGFLDKEGNVFWKSRLNTQTRESNRQICWFDSQLLEAII